MTFQPHEYIILALISIIIIGMSITGLNLTNKDNCAKDKDFYNSVFIGLITIAGAFCFSVLLTFLLNLFNLNNYEIYIRISILIVFQLIVTIFVQKIRNSCNQEDSEYILGMSYLLIVLSIIYIVYSIYITSNSIPVIAVPIR